METRKFILDKAYKLGNTALVDPVPELWDEVSITSRADTMCSYFTGMLDSLEREYEEKTSEKVSPQLESEIVSARDVMDTSSQSSGTGSTSAVFPSL